MVMASAPRPSDLIGRDREVSSRRFDSNRRPAVYKPEPGGLGPESLTCGSSGCSGQGLEPLNRRSAVKRPKRMGCTRMCASESRVCVESSAPGVARQERDILERAGTVTLIEHNIDTRPEPQPMGRCPVRSARAPNRGARTRRAMMSA